MYIYIFLFYFKSARIKGCFFLFEKSRGATASRFKGVTVHRLVRVWRKMRASHAVRSLLFLPSDKKIANKNVWISWSNAVISLASKQQIGTIAAPLLFFTGARAILRNRVLCNTYMGKGSFFNFLIRCIFPVQFLTYVDTCSVRSLLLLVACGVDAMARKCSLRR